MPIRNSSGRYTAIAQTLHWLIAGLIVTQFVLAISADDLPIGAHKLALLARHKSFGMTVLMLAILRLLWRLKNPPPELPAGMTHLERVLARISHAAFYVLLPDANGVCAANTLPVYKFFDNRADANQRHTIDLSVRRAMINRAWVPQGVGPNFVAWCTPI